MKVVILAGGLGTRISEESHLRPKPMIEVGGRPILWHIMKIYSSYGFNDFIICCGYKGYVIKEYFVNYFLHNSDITINIKNNKVEVHENGSEPWSVTVVDTGENTMTGGRVKRIQKYLKPDESFCLTYGDGVADLNIADLVKFHKAHGKMATVTATRPPGRFGQLHLEDKMVTHFEEKPLGEGGYINGGFFVLNSDVLNFIPDDSTVWEKGPLENITKSGQLAAFLHDGFWQPMDTLRDKNYLESLWSEGKAPWKKW